MLKDGVRAWSLANLRICPTCSSYDIHRSRTRSTWEALRRKLTSKRPYRCRTCGLRVWHMDIGPGVGEYEFPDALQESQSTAHDGAAARRQWPTDLDLEQLDTPRGGND